VLRLVPPRAEAQLDAPAGHLVDLRDRDRERARLAERRRGHERAQPDSLGLHGQGAQRDPGVGGAGQPAHSAHLQEVVGPEEGVEPAVLRLTRHPQQLLVRRALLRLGEDAELHPSAIQDRPAELPDARRRGPDVS
jgi:hypothetical protein